MTISLYDLINAGLFLLLGFVFGVLLRLTLWLSKRTLTARRQLTASGDLSVTGENPNLQDSARAPPVADKAPETG